MASPETNFSYDDVARRAYELYQSRGGEHGHDVEDWIHAEAELRARMQASVSGRRPETEARPHPQASVSTPAREVEAATPRARPAAKRTSTKR